MAPSNLRHLGEAPKLWLWAALWFVAIVAAVSTLTWNTLGSLVSIWSRSETFAHGFLVPLISIWLVWESRARLGNAVPLPNFLAIAAVIPLGMVWFAGRVSDTLVVEHLAFTGLVVLAVFGVVGNRAFKLLAFPAFFLFFAVPIGEGLVPPMIDFTADFTVEMLKVFGIPVYREGNIFTIPSGKWSVVEACSGVRYLIASLTLGVLFAYLTYQRWYKRIIFVAFAIIVPVLANGIRAFVIVMIGHLSDMRLATGVDHLIYGWLFFGVVIFLMFAIGSIWRDPPHDAGNVNVQRSSAATLGLISLAQFPLLAFAFVGAMIPWVLVGPADTAGTAQKLTLGQIPQSLSGWEYIRERDLGWQPEVEGADAELSGVFVKGREGVGVYVGLFRYGGESAEMVTSRNVMVSESSDAWVLLSKAPSKISTRSGPGAVTEYRVAGSDGRRLMIWTWYRIGDSETRNRYLAKLLEAWLRLTREGPHHGTILAVATEYEGNVEQARDRLQGFLNASGGGLRGLADGCRSDMVDRLGPQGADLDIVDCGRVEP